MSHKEFMTSGLKRLARLKGDQDVLQRDPCSSLSFSCATDDIVKNQEEMMAKYVEGQQQAFSPLGPDGRPIRKWVHLPFTIDVSRMQTEHPRMP